MDSKNNSKNNSKIVYKNTSPKSPLKIGDEKTICPSCSCEFKNSKGYCYCFECNTTKTKLQQCEGRTKAGDRCKLKCLKEYCYYHGAKSNSYAVATDNYSD